jgi:hypothetical protein
LLNVLGQPRLPNRESTGAPSRRMEKTLRGAVVGPRTDRVPTKDEANV